MDDQKNQQTGQPTDQAQVATPADPMSTATMSTPPMPTPGAGVGMSTGNSSTDPMGMPPAPAMPSIDSMTSSMSTPPSTSAPVTGGSTPASLDEVLAELKKIEDKLVEMDEKL